ncbi:MAG: aspartate aminotransferase family protein [Nitrososphaerota archaeon]|nr:aspartate aminotransferase family protein [Nitrososphaerota archaeon]
MPDELDVDLNRAEFKAVNKETARMLLEFFEGVRSKRVFPGRKPSQIQKLLAEPLPSAPQDPLKIVREVERKIIPNSTFTGSPRYFGFVMGSGTTMSVFGDAIAAAINQNPGVWKASPAATELERVVVRWFAEMVGYDRESAGILTTGGTMANVAAIATALHDRAGYDFANEGIQSEKRKGRFTLYMSDHEGHSSVVKAAQLLGLGRSSVRRVKSDDDFTMNVESLEEAIEKDAAEGNTPFCVVAQVGSINVGVVDPLREIARVCSRHNMWFHADGACGAFGRIIPRKAHLFEGLELADSVTLDPHKWLFISYQCGCVLVKDPLKLRNTFTQHAAYLKGILPTEYTGLDYHEYGPQMSRGFTALKVWMSLKQIGVKRYSRLLGRDVALVEYLDKLVRSSEEFEPLCKPVLQMYCFRFVPKTKKLAEDEVDSLNQRIADEAQLTGKAFLMTTSIRGKTALRLSVTNHRTRKEDVDLTFNLLRRIGRKLAAGT